MKIAIVHDYIKEYGGAERVLESLHSIYPKAPVFTSVYLPQFLGPHRSRFENWDVRTSWAQKIPFVGKLISPMRLIAPILFKSFDFSEYDIVIVSATGAFLPNSINKKNAKLICYCHTPPKHLYGYETARDWRRNKLEAIIGVVAIHILRILDFKYSKNVDFYIANSEEVKKRIQKFYRRDSSVVYPPVSVQLPKTKIKRGNYYLTGGRIVRAKHPDLIVEVFAKLGLPLKVFGKSFAGFQKELDSRLLKTNNVEFLGEISDERKSVMMAGARGFIFAGRDEDFGITPVEAMMAGTPVISHRSGGPKETIIEGKTGVFFDEFSAESLGSAIKKFEKTKFNNEEIAKYAKKFSKERFEKEIKDFVGKVTR